MRNPGGGGSGGRLLWGQIATLSSFSSLLYICGRYQIVKSFFSFRCSYTRFPLDWARRSSSLRRFFLSHCGEERKKKASLLSTHRVGRRRSRSESRNVSLIINSQRAVDVVQT